MTFSQGYALLVGVGVYQKIPKANVPIAANDAQSVANVLKDPQTCGYLPTHVKLVLNENATKAGVLNALDQMANCVEEKDTVFIFYCGHGSFGEDGKYYLVTYDAGYTQRVVAGTGISDEDLIDKLRTFKAKRLLVTLNTCYSGNVSPTLEFEDQALNTSNPPEDATSAILATGSGRLIITATGENQKSYIGKGVNSIFTKALIDGLQGKGVTNKGGFIGAFNLYEYIYETVSKTVKEQLNFQQEPELTVLKGVGPFPISLYKGATSLGEFDTNQPVPDLPTVHQVKLEKAMRLIKNYPASINTKNIDTGGGAYIDGNINTSGGDFIGRDRIGNEVFGDNYNVGDISGGGNVIVGRNAQISVGQGLSGDDISKVFLPIYNTILNMPLEKREEATNTVKALQNEVEKGKKSDDGLVARLINQLVDLVPGAVSALANAFGSPVLAAFTGPITKWVLEQIHGK